jgi:uncharacterized protein (DUF111 family)
MEKPGTLFLFQIDHLSGEEVGFLVDTLYEWGASNVNVISSLTKKNRPGHLILVDPGRLDGERLPNEMASLFGTCGYHRLETVHFHLATQSQRTSLRMRCGDRVLREEIRIKAIEGPTEPLSRRAEHDSLVSLCTRVQQEWGVKLSLPKVRRWIEEKLREGAPLELELKLSE